MGVFSGNSFKSFDTVRLGIALDERDTFSWGKGFKGHFYKLYLYYNDGMMLYITNILYPT